MYRPAKLLPENKSTNEAEIGKGGAYDNRFNMLDTAATARRRLSVLVDCCAVTPSLYASSRVGHVIFRFPNHPFVGTDQLDFTAIASLCLIAYLGCDIATVSKSVISCPCFKQLKPFSSSHIAVAHLNVAQKTLRSDPSILAYIMSRQLYLHSLQAILAIVRATSYSAMFPTLAYASQNMPMRFN